MKKTKGLIAWLLVFAMVLSGNLSTIPAQVQAAENNIQVNANTTIGDLNNLIAGAEDGTVLILNGDLTVRQTRIVFGNEKNITLDLNGYTITGNSNNDMTSVIMVENGTKLTLKDSEGNLDQNTIEYNVVDVKVNDADKASVSTEETLKKSYVGGGITISSGATANHLIYLTENSTLNIEGGAIYGGNSNENGAGIYALDSTVNLYSGVIVNNESANFGGGIALEHSNLEINAKDGLDSAVISGNTAANRGGGIYAYNGAIEDTNDNGLFEEGDGLGAKGNSENKSTITINDPNCYITDNHAYKQEGNEIGTHLDCGGGGLRLDDDTVFVMNAGYITGNTSGAGGGGIMAGYYNTLGWSDDKQTPAYDYIATIDRVYVTVNGGIIGANESQREGAGISIGGNCNGRITGEKLTYITNNTVAHDTTDWGGGGLFVADASTDAEEFLVGEGLNDYIDRGYLSIQKAVITNNTAYGFGGGVAGCATAHTYINPDENLAGSIINKELISRNGVAVYGNTATAEHDNYVAKEYDNSGTDHLSGASSAKNRDRIATNGNKVFWEEGFEDYFCANYTLIGNTMLGGGSENWSGSYSSETIEDDSTASITSTAVAEGNNQNIASTTLAGLNANASEEDKEAAEKLAMVWITGNSSGTHGGGILANGTLILGDDSTTVIYANDFIISVEDAQKINEGAAAVENINESSDAALYQKDYRITENKIVVTKDDATKVEATEISINDLAGVTEPTSVDVTLTDPNNNAQDVTVKATVVDETATGTSTDGDNSEIVIGANHYNISLEQAQAIVNALENSDATPDKDATDTMNKILANAVATEAGVAVDCAEIIVDASNIKAEKGDYEVTFTYDGVAVTVTATVKDAGTTDDGIDPTDVPDINLTANDFTVEGGSGEITEDAFKSDTYAKVEANNQDGSSIPSSQIDVNDDELKVLNDKIAAGKVDKANVTVTTGNVKTTVTVTITAKNSKIEANDFIIKVGDAVTEEKVVDLSGAEYFDTTTSTGDKTKVDVDDTDFATLRDQKEPGTVDVTLKDETGTVSKEVTATVVDKTEEATVADKKVVIGANNFNVTIAQAEAIQAASGDDATKAVEAMVKTLANAVATDGDVKVAQTDIGIKDVTVIKAENGNYNVTFTYGGVEVTVTATVKDAGAGDGSDNQTQVPELNLTGNDFVVEAGSNNQLTDEAFKTNAEIEANYNDGSSVENVKVDEADLTNLNNAIKADTRDTDEYKVDVTATSADGTSVVTTTITVTVKDKKTTDVAKQEVIAANHFEIILSEYDVVVNSVDELIKRSGALAYDADTRADVKITDATVENAKKEVGTYNVTLRTGQGTSVTITMTVKADDSYIAANDFIISVNDTNKTTADEVKELSDAEYFGENTSTGDKTKVVVDDTDLSTLKNQTEPGTVEVTLNDTTGTVSTEVTATVVDKTEERTVDNKEVVIGANNFNISKEQAAAIEAGKTSNADAVNTLVKELANAVATANGTAVDVSEIKVSKNDISATGDGPFDVTFTYGTGEDAVSVTVQATVKDDGPTDGNDGQNSDDLRVPETNLTANDFAVETGSPELSEEDFIDKADVEANDENGSSVTPKVDPDDLADLNDAIKNGPAGTYPVEVTTPDGTATTVTVTVTEEYPSIVANDFIIGMDTVKTADDAVVRDLSDATRYESEGNEAGTDNIEVKASDLNKLNSVTEPGKMNVTLKDGSTGAVAADVTVEATIVDETADGTANDGSGSDVVIGANNFNVSKEQAAAIESGAASNAEAVDALVKELANAVATENGQPVDREQINVKEIEITDDNNNNDTVTFEYKGQEVLVKVTVKDAGSTDGGTDNDLTVPETNLTGNDFSVEEGSPELSEEDFIKDADVEAKDENGSSVEPTVDPDDLEDLNDAITNQKPGEYEVKVTTPDGTSTTITVTVTERYPRIEGSDFIISVTDAKDVTEPEVVSLSKAERYESAGNQNGNASEVTVDADDLAVLKNKGAKDETGAVTVTLKDATNPANQADIALDKNVTATVVDETSTSDVNAAVVIGANNFNVTIAQAEAIQTASGDDATKAVEAMVKTLANAVATKDGKAVPQAEIGIKDVKVIKAENGNYNVTFTYGGEEVTVVATVKDAGAGDDSADQTKVPDVNVTGNDFVVKVGTTPELTPDAFKDAANADVEASYNDGSSVPDKDIIVNQSDLDKLNDAIEAGKVGPYDVKVSVGDKTTTITVTVTDEKETNTVDPSNNQVEVIAANNFEITLADYDKVVGSEDELIKRSEAVAYDADTKAEVKVTGATVADPKKEAGAYKVTLSTDKGSSVTVTMTIQTVPSITANDFNLTIEQAQTIVNGQNDASVMDAVKELAGATAKEDSVVQDPSKITVDAGKIQAAEGSYDVTFTYNGKSVTVKATVKAADNTDGDKDDTDGDKDNTDVPDVTLTAKDFSVVTGSAALTADDFNKKAEVVAKKTDGTAVTATPDAADLAKLNEAIQNCAEGTYDVKVTAGDKTATVKVTVTKPGDTIGEDRIFEISNPRDITQELDQGREVSKVTVDGTDIAAGKYKVDGNTLIIDDSVFQKKKADTTSTVVITYKDGSKKTYNVKIVSYDKETVVTKVPTFHMQKDIGVGKKFTINLVGTDKYSVKKFKSSNKKIATVNSKGVITAKKKGKCKITATIIQKGSYYTVKIDLHVKKSMKMYNLKKAALQKKQGVLPEFNVYKRIVKGKKTKLKFTNVTKDAKITYKTSNKKIATVTKKGVIKGKKKGFCVVTAKIEQNGYTYYTKLIVRVDDGTKNKQLKKYLK